MSETKEFIIDEAYKLFLTHSYEAVSVSTISEALGLTKGALYHHFASKEELFKEVIKKHFPLLKSDISAITSVENLIEKCTERAEAIIRAMNPKDMDFNPIGFIGMMSDAFRHYEDFDKSCKADIDEYINDIKTLVIKAIGNKEIRSDIDPSVVAMLIFSTAISSAIEIFHNHTVEETVNTLRLELIQLYNLLKI